MSKRDYLLLQLHAPMASFGGAAVDNLGVTRRFPAKSMLTGLLANALGWRRQDYELLQQLQERISYAVRLEQPVDGRQWRDFQTAGIKAADKHWTTSGIRRERAGGAKSYSGPHLRYRDYLHDLRAGVALTLRTVDNPQQPDLTACEQALLQPARPIFIGRKSCLPSAPLFVNRTTAAHAMEALQNLPLAENHTGDLPCFWVPGEGPDSMEGINSYALCDERDWANSQHAGSRMVCEAQLSVEWFRETTG